METEKYGISQSVYDKILAAGYSLEEQHRCYEISKEIYGTKLCLFLIRPTRISYCLLDEKNLGYLLNAVNVKPIDGIAEELNQEYIAEVIKQRLMQCFGD